MNGGGGIAIRLALKTRRVPFEILGSGIVGCGRRIIAVVVRLGLSLGSSFTFLCCRAIIRRRTTVIIIIIRGGRCREVFVFDIVVVVATIHMLLLLLLRWRLVLYRGCHWCGRCRRRRRCLEGDLLGRVAVIDLLAAAANHGRLVLLV